MKLLCTVLAIITSMTIFSAVPVEFSGVTAMKGTTVKGEVKSGSFSFSFNPGSGAYGKIILKLAKPVDMQGRILSFEAKGDRAPKGFYVRLYNAGQKKPVWSFVNWKKVNGNSWKKFSLQKGYCSQLTWETGVVAGVPADKVDRIEIIGGEYNKKSAVVDLEFRNIRITEGISKKNSLFGSHPEIAVISAMSGTSVDGSAATPEVKLSFNRKDGRYGKITLQLADPVNLENKILQIKCRSDRAPAGMYIRCFNVGEKKPVWSFSSWGRVSGKDWKTLDLQKEDGQLLHWERGVVVNAAADRIDRIEIIIGEHKNSNEIFDLNLKEFKILPAPPSVKTLNKVPELSRNTVRKNLELLLYPDTAAGKRIAGKIAALLPGIKMQCGKFSDRLPEKGAIIIGSIADNPAMLALYARNWSSADSIFPGKGKFILQTIPDAFHRGKDLVVLEASDDSGLAAGAEKLCEELSKGKEQLPFFFIVEANVPVEIPGEFERGIAEAKKKLAAGVHTSLGGELANIGKRYLRYRRPVDARLFVKVAEIYLADSLANPEKLGGPWGFDSDFRAFEAIGAWDIIEHDPVLTAADRQAVTGMLGTWLKDAMISESIAGLGENGVLHNHTTFATLGTLAGWMYFKKYYPDLPELGLWEKIIIHNFNRQKNSLKVRDDCNGYCYLTWRHLMTYAMVSENAWVFDNAHVSGLLRTFLASMDNLGYSSPFGDTGNWNWNSGGDCLRMIYAVTRDPLCAAILQYRRNIDSANPGSYFITLPEKSDIVNMPQLDILPLPAKFYQTFFRAGQPPVKNCFDKCSFRDSLDPQKFYLLLDGVNTGGHGHEDASSVIRYSHYGRLWFADNDYFRKSRKFHNTLLVLQDGQSVKLADYSTVLSRSQNKDFYSVVLGNDLWQRTIIRFPGTDAWLAIDRVKAGKSGKLRLTQRWNVIGEAELLADGAKFSQKGAGLCFRGDPRNRFNIFENAELGQNWGGYPYARPVVQVTDQVIERTVKAGEYVVVPGLWCRPEVFSAVRVMPDGRIWFRIGEKAWQIALDGNNAVSVTPAAVSAAVTAKSEKGSGKEEKFSTAEVAAEFYAPGGDIFFYNHPKNRNRFSMKFSGTAATGDNILSSVAENHVKAVFDGSWSGAGDSVMYQIDQPVQWEVEFGEKQQVAAVKIIAWWGSSSKGTSYNIDRFEILADGKKVGEFSTENKSYPNFGTPAELLCRFSPVEAKKVSVKVFPRPGSALYCCELLIGRIADRNYRSTGAYTAIEAGKEQVAAGSESGVLEVYGLNGKMQWKKQLPDKINAVAISSRGDIIAGSGDRLYGFNKSGSELFVHNMPANRSNSGDVNVIKMVDLNRDGVEEILAGCSNWNCYAFTADGKKMWQFEVVHPCLTFGIFDLNGDGIPEVMCGTKWYWMTALKASGKSFWRVNFGPGCRAFAFGERNNRCVYVAAGAENGCVAFFTPSGKKIREFDTGDEVRCLASGENGKIWVGSYNGYIYRLDERSAPEMRDLQGGITALCKLPDGGVAAGTDKGGLFLFGRDFSLRQKYLLPAPVINVIYADNAVWVIMKDGRLWKIKHNSDK